MKKKTLDKKTRNLILILFLIGVFMGSLDTGIIGPVLPSIEQSFNLTSRESSWIFTLFVITFMIGSPIMAKFSDFYGRKKIFILDETLSGIAHPIVSSIFDLYEEYCVKYNSIMLFVSHNKEYQQFTQNKVEL